MTATQIVVALFILCLCGTIILLRKSNETYTGPEQCWNCNDHMCSVCPTYDPMFCEVKSAYVKVSKNGRVVATTTLTFDKDFVFTQHPKYHSMPDLIGMYKTELIQWAEAEKSADVEISFS